MDSLTAFGLFAVTAMLVFYALEKRSRSFILAFSAACLLGSVLASCNQPAAEQAELPILHRFHAQAPPSKHGPRAQDGKSGEGWRRHRAISMKYWTIFST